MSAEPALGQRSPHVTAVGATVAEAVAEALAEAGITAAFTFPGGGSNLPLLAALRRRGVPAALAHSEIGAAYMAATSADLLGTPGLLVTGVGPGVANSVNGIAQAYLDRSPLLIVTDRYSPGEEATSGHQVLDQLALLAPVVKWQADLDPLGARETVRQAVATACAHPQGPVHLELRRDAVGAPAGGHPKTAPVWAAAPADSAALEAAAEAVSDARRPILLVGHEARRGVPQQELVAFAERLRAPVLSTYKAKGVFPETHRLAAGIVTGAEIERPLLEQADLFLAVGFDPVELLARPWPFQAPLVALRASSASDGHLRPRLTLVGDVGALIAALAASLTSVRSEWGGEEAAAFWAQALESLRLGDGLTSWRIVEIAAEELPPETTATVDAGAHMFAATCFWRATRPNEFLISNGLATMGYAVPAALAAAFTGARGDVVAFVGDGGFLMSAAELETAVRLGVKILVVVLNDASLSLIRIKQDEADRKGLDFVQSDFARLAESLGAAGFRAANEAELRQALREAQAQPRPAVVDVSITGDEYREMQRVIRG